MRVCCYDCRDDKAEILSICQSFDLGGWLRFGSRMKIEGFWVERVYSDWGFLSVRGEDVLIG